MPRQGWAIPVAALLLGQACVEGDGPVHVGTAGPFQMTLVQVVP